VKSNGAFAEGAAPAITEQEAAAIATDAYLYLYPLVTTDVTRKQGTNIEAAGLKPGFAPMNAFPTGRPSRRPT